jgi:heme exporter protein CcmB
MTRTLRQIALLVAKDLRIEARTRQTLGLVTVLGILIVVVLGLGLGAQQGGVGHRATAVLWVAYLFAGVLCFEKTMSVERHDGALAGLLVAPVDRGTIYAAKLISNLVMMLAVALVVTPAGVVFFGFDLSAAPGQFALVIGLSMLGFAAVGTLFAALVSSSRLAGGLLALVVFPLTLPVVIASTQIMLGIFRDGQDLGGMALGVLGAFDVVFLAASWVMFEWVLEP